MTTIPEDVMQTAEEAYNLALHDSMAGKADFIKHVALAILAERGGWQDISTAPKHTKGHSWNRSVLLTDGDCIFIGFWNGRSWDDGDFQNDLGDMTHWMPLPDLPKPPVSSANVEGATHE